MDNNNCIDLILAVNNNQTKQPVGQIRIIDNSKVDVISADEPWQERINYMTDVINTADSIPLIVGTKVNRIAAFSMMEDVQKGDKAFPDAVIAYLAINGFDAQIKNN